MARRCGVGKKALELYQRHGLLEPAKTDAWTGYRYYTETQCETVERIRTLQAVGFTLSEIGGILKSQDTAYLHAALEEKVKALQSSMAALMQATQLAQEMLRRC